MENNNLCKTVILQFRIYFFRITKKIFWRVPGKVVHTYNSSYSGDGDKIQLRQKVSEIPPSQQKSQYGGMSKTLSKKITGAKNS
jgi:hypothetical protein